MYVHLGADVVIRSDEIIAICDLDTSTVSKRTRDCLSAAEKSGHIVNVGTELPKSFVLTDNKIYITQISAPTLQKRTTGK